MSDRNVEIGIKAVGGQQAAQEITKASNALDAPGIGLGDHAKKADAKLAGLANQQNKVTASSVNMRFAMQNIGYQIQDIAVQAEMGTNAMRIVSQQVPQMLGGFGMWGAIAGTVIAIGAPLIGSLMGQGKAAKDAGKDVKKLAEEYKELADVYADLEKDNLEGIKESAKETEKQTQNRLASIETTSKLENNANNLQAAREKAEAMLALANQRISLATIESALTTSSGKAALDLARAREQVILNIFQSELQISDVGRRQALGAAETKVAAASSKVDVSKEVTDKAQEKYNAARKEQEDLREAAELKKEQRWQKIADLEDQMLKAKIKLEHPDVKFGIGPQGDYERTRLEGTIKNITEAINKANLASRDEGELYVQANAKQPALDELKKILGESEKAQSEAFRALTSSLLDITNLKRTQGIERKSEAELKAAGAETQIGEKVTDSAKSAIKQIKDGGLDKYPGAGSEAVEGITKLLNDTTPDAKQGGQLAGLLQQLANNLTGKDAMIATNIQALIGIVKSLADQQNSIKSQVDGLKTNVGQKR